MPGLKHPSPPFGGQPFLIAVATGAVKGYSVVQVIGRNPDIAGTAEDIWEEGGALVWPSVAAVISTVSSDPADDVGGTGALTVYYEGLDTNYLPISETVIMTGATPALTLQSFLRVNSSRVVLVGSAGANVGIIRGSVGGNVQTHMQPLDGTTHRTQYTLAAGARGWLIDSRTWQGKDSPMDGGFWRRPLGESWYRKSHLLTYRIQTDAPGFFTDGFSEKSDIKMTAIRDGAGAAISVVGSYTMLIKDY